MFSATDLVAYLECERLTVPDFQALGDADVHAGTSAPDASAGVIARKGDKHERVALVNTLCWVAESGQLE